MMHLSSLPMILSPVAALVAVLPAAAVTPQGAAAINERIDALRGRSYDDAVLRLYQTRLLTMLPLIRDGENVNTTKGNENGSTALHYACGLGDAELVEVLLACGADPAIKTAKGASTELCIGSDPGGKIRKLLRNPKKAALPAASAAATPQSGAAAAINACIASLQARSYDDGVLRLYQTRLLAMLPLIRDGENVNTTKGNESGSTALHYACGLGDAELVEVLLACGADPSIKTAKGASTELCIGSDPGGKIRKLLRNPKKAVLPAVDTAAPAPVSATAHTATADWAPADVSNRTVKILRSMELEAFRDEGWEWKPSEDASPVTLKFQQGNTYVPLQGKDAPGKGYGNKVTYKKTGPATATITVATWEQEVTYTLEFTSKKGGNVTTDAHCEGTEWKARDATFTIR